MRTSLSSPRGGSRFRSRDSFNAAAALGVVAAPTLAQAQIVWSGILNATVNSGTTLALLDFNLNSSPDAAEAYLSYLVGEKSDPSSLGVTGVTSHKVDPSIAFLYDRSPLTFGAVVDSNRAYVGEGSSGIIADGNPYHFAFSYQTAGGPYYGWMEITFSADQSHGTLHQWAYNSDSGASLTAGQTTAIPEPATVGALLSVTALGVACWWRRRVAART